MHRIAIYSADEAFVSTLFDVLAPLGDPRNQIETAIPADLFRLESLNDLPEASFDLLIYHHPKDEVMFPIELAMAGGEAKLMVIAPRSETNDRIGEVLRRAQIDYLVYPFASADLLLRIKNKLKPQA